MKKRCLMVRMPDKRCFFTHERNCKQLEEFRKTFNAQLLVVRADVEIKELPELVEVFCCGAGQDHSDVEVLETRSPSITMDRQSSIRLAGRIRRVIERALLNGKCVSVRSLRKRYSKYGLSVSCLCNHVRYVKSKLEAHGYTVKRSARGCYEITNIMFT